MTGFSFDVSEITVTDAQLIDASQGRIKKAQLLKFENDCGDVFRKHEPEGNEGLTDDQREARRKDVAQLLHSTLCSWLPIFESFKIVSSPSADELSEWFNLASRGSKTGSLAIIYVRERARKMFGTASKWIAIGFTAEEAKTIEQVQTAISLVNQAEVLKMEELKKAPTWNGPRTRDIVRTKDEERRKLIRQIAVPLHIAFLKFSDLSETTKIEVLTRDLSTAERQKEEKKALQNCQRALVKEYRSAIGSDQEFNLIEHATLDQFKGF